jgi:hypothetical protein
VNCTTSSGIVMTIESEVLVWWLFVIVVLLWISGQIFKEKR